MTKEIKKVSDIVIRRLSKYHRYLSDLLDRNVDRISSQEPSGLTGFTVSQIHQDLNNFGGFGQQGYGYDVQVPHAEISKILGIDKTYKAVVVGASRLGPVVSTYSGFKAPGFEIMVIFDKNPKKIDKVIDGFKVYSLEEMADFIKKNKVEAGITTIPKDGSRKTADDFIAAGVKGI